MHPFARVAEVFLKKGAISPKTALKWKELGFSMELKKRVDATQGKDNPVIRTDGKYYLSKKRLEAFRTRIRQAHPIRRWLQHTAAVPKGFLRYRVLQILKEQPMSGSELTSEIGKETGGRWKPKPGSMYPLLKHLLKDGLTTELPVEGGIKRYDLTEEGRTFFDEDVCGSGEIQAKLGFWCFPMHSFPFLSGLSDAKLESLPPPHRVLLGLARLRHIMASDVSDEAMSEIDDMMIRFADEIEKLVKKYSKPAD
ncbi:MAG: PadR family transcriptional regulator [Candidatus Thorarchaeota archaeon]|nr:PadR family transcriptional regulator [Candidatus Thorarchaeota archaeon]